MYSQRFCFFSCLSETKFYTFITSLCMQFICRGIVTTISKGNITLPADFAAGDSWEGEGFLFVQDSGKHMGKSMHPDSVTSYCDKFSDKYNLPHINPHAFRHTQASLLLFAGLDLITVSRHLGHAKPSTTSDLYAHVMQEAESRVAEAMGSILFSTRKQLPKSDEEQDKQPADIAG